MLALFVVFQVLVAGKAYTIDNDHCEDSVDENDGDHNDHITTNDKPHPTTSTMTDDNDNDKNDNVSDCQVF